MRRTGIETIGDIPWGSHFCQFYRTRQDLTDILVPYFKQGLQDNELRMIELKQEVNILCLKAGLPPAYKRVFENMG